MNKVSGYEKRKNWYRMNILDMEKQMKTFKKKGLVVFGELQCLEMGSVKWYIFDYIC